MMSELTRMDPKELVINTAVYICMSLKGFMLDFGPSVLCFKDLGLLNTIDSEVGVLVPTVPT